MGARIRSTGRPAKGRGTTPLAEEKSGGLFGGTTLALSGEAFEHARHLSGPSLTLQRTVTIAQKDPATRAPGFPGSDRGPSIAENRRCCDLSLACSPTPLWSLSPRAYVEILCRRPSMKGGMASTRAWMGGANGSRECAPDDKLRVTHQLPSMPRWVSQRAQPILRAIRARRAD